MNRKVLDLDKYRGEWIALVKDKMVAHGKDLNKVAEKAKKENKKPVFEKIPESGVMVL